jgi:bifunctional non-homologous end joining protein LigD
VVVPRSRVRRDTAQRISGRSKDPTSAFAIAGITITNAQKILWPADGSEPAVTKGELGRYFEAVAPRILPHIEGRPLSIVRAPDGIGGQRFFQRHAPPGTVDALLQIPVPGEAKPFVGVASVRGLIALAQAAVLEIHPWGSKKGDPETPDRVIFDLDPAPDVAFERVIAAAKTMRARLQDCGLTPFLKTTGGKGLHVVVAITGNSRKSATWSAAKEFAQALCISLARDEPDAYTTNMSKRARVGKIFLDYLRNDRMATAVAPWSPRARPHAPIALPITWNQLRSGLDPSRFTIATAATLLRRADPWADIDRSAGALHEARKSLGL